MKKNTYFIFTIVFGLGLFLNWGAEAKQKKVLYVDSYHAEYKPSIIMHKAVKNILDPAGVQVKFTYMDAKRQKSDIKLQEAALRIKKTIEVWNPDVVIAADDAASKFLVSPYYSNSMLPFVFIGVNWEVKQYGYPYKNVTGQVEVELVQELLNELKKYARGTRIGFLAGQTLTDQKALKYYQNKFGIDFHQIEFVDNFNEWRKAYQVLQTEVDILFFRNNSGIEGWNNKEAWEFIRENTLIPSGSVSTHLYPLVLISYAKVNREFGEYGAKTALQILNGKPASEIPITQNKQAKIHINMKLAKKIGIRFPVELIHNAHLVSAEQKRLLFVNSYHKGYKWSDDIEKGLFKALNIKESPDGSLDNKESDIDIQVFRMDTKLNQSESYKKKAAIKAKAIIEEWRPDIVVTSDDNAAKYLIEPFYKKSSIPFVFCGVNWDSSMYGFPTSNITGMVEVSPAIETVEMLKKYSKGDRLGLIASNNLSAQKNVDKFKNVLGIRFSEINLVNDFAQWKEKYLKLQTSVDMMLLLNPIGVKGWDAVQAKEFILANTKIPSGTISDNNMPYVLLGRVKIAEEQGWWAGKTALKVLNGTAPADIPITTNKESVLYLNMPIAKKIGIKFPIRLLNEATLLTTDKD